MGYLIVHALLDLRYKKNSEALKRKIPNTTSINFRKFIAPNAAKKLTKMIAYINNYKKKKTM